MNYKLVNSINLITFRGINNNRQMKKQINEEIKRMQQLAGLKETEYVDYQGEIPVKEAGIGWDPNDPLKATASETGFNSAISHMIEAGFTKEELIEYITNNWEEF